MGLSNSTWLRHPDVPGRAVAKSGILLLAFLAGATGCGRQNSTDANLLADLPAGT